MRYNLAGIPIEESPRQRAHRKVPLDPTNPKTWHESDAQERLKERLRLGSWVAWHVRKQGHREAWGREHEGIIEAVPARAAWGVLDWVCIPTSLQADGGVLWIELKSEKGKLTTDQAQHALWLAQAGQEVAVLRPRHFFGRPDLVLQRLVHYDKSGAWPDVLVQPDWSIEEVLRL